MAAVYKILNDFKNFQMSRNKRLQGNWANDVICAIFQIMKIKSRRGPTVDCIPHKWVAAAEMYYTNISKVTLLVDVSQLEHVSPAHFLQVVASRHPSKYLNWLLIVRIRPGNCPDLSSVLPL